MTNGIRDRRAAAMRRKSELISMVSHELRAPLNAILLWAKILQDPAAAANPNHLRDGLAAIVRGAEAQRQLIEELQELSRIIDGDLDLHLEDTELLPVVRHAVVAAVEASAGAKGVTLLSSASDEATVVRADRDRLRQIVGNLLSHALKSAAPSGSITVEPRRTRDEVELRVAQAPASGEADEAPDAGPGRRADTAGSPRKTLGLLIAEELAILLGGRVVSHPSKLSKGLALSMVLPLRDAPRHQARHPGRQRR